MTSPATQVKSRRREPGAPGPRFEIPAPASPLATPLPTTGPAPALPTPAPTHAAADPRERATIRLPEDFRDVLDNAAAQFWPTYRRQARAAGIRRGDNAFWNLLLAVGLEHLGDLTPQQVLDLLRRGPQN